MREKKFKSLDTHGDIYLVKLSNIIIVVGIFREYRE